MTMNVRARKFRNARARVSFKLLFICMLSLGWSCGVVGNNSVEDGEMEAPNTGESEGPSFDCDKASNSVEKVICGSPKISRLDRKQSELYHQLIELPGRREPLGRDQLKWLREKRNACKDATMPPGYDHPREVAIERCLYPAYSKRITELKHSELCHAFSAIMEEYGFEALVDSENLRGNKYGIEIPEIEPVTDEQIKSLPEKTIEWGYMKSEKYSETEKLGLIEERKDSLRSAMDRWGTEMFQASVDYDDDGGDDKAIILRPTEKKVSSREFRGKYFIFDESFNIRDKYYDPAGGTGWMTEFLGDLYHYTTGYSAKKEVNQVYVSKIYDPGSGMRIRPKQVCQLEL